MKKTILTLCAIYALTTLSAFAGADAGIEQEVAENATVQLNGSRTTADNYDGVITHVEWKQILVNGIPKVRIFNKYSLNSTFVAPIVNETVVLKFKLITTELYDNYRKVNKTVDYVNVIVFEKNLKAPTNLKVIKFNNDNVTLKFKDNANNETHFEIYSAITGKRYKKVQAHAGTGSVTTTLHGLNSNAKDKIFVITRIGDLKSEKSNTIFIRTFGSR